MQIVVDRHEAPVVASCLRDSEFRVVVRSLPVGDYDLGNGVLVERKTIADFRASLADGRLWRQLGRLRGARVPYLVLEGPDVLPAVRDADAVRGAILTVADLGVVVLRTRDQRDTATWLKLIARRRQAQPMRRRPPHAGIPATAEHSAPVRILSGIDGVSARRARALLERFGTVADVANASVEELAQTPGLFGTLAQRIHESLH